MAEKSLGYVELEWECPNCRSRNPGTARTCANCGAPHPEEVQFQQAAQEQLVADQAQIAAAQAGPDIHCAYCGTRNPATAKTCKQCGADLGEGKARSAGQVLGAYRDKPAPPVTCPSCGASNPATARKCSQCGETLIKEPQPAARPAPPVAPRFNLGLLLAVILAGIVGIAALVLILGSRTTEQIGQVTGVNWRRTIAIEALVPVTRETWRDELPSGVEAGRCADRLYKVQDQPAPGAKEVCGTPYVVDKGNGFGEVIQTCRYEIYKQWCQYQTLAWERAAPLVLEGADLSPRWPALNLGENQRAAGRSEDYTVTLRANDRTYTYKPRSPDEFARFRPDSRWRLKVSGLGGVQVTGPQ
jgi:predicted nucleic acid-binding Zn ribbon protein